MDIGRRIIMRREKVNMTSLYNDRPHPDPLPQEREQHLDAFGFSDAPSTNPAFGSRKQREAILLLLGEKAGMRAVVTPSK